MEAVGATASIVGIVSFGLGLAKSLQAYIDSVIDADETIILIVADVNTTASALKELQDFIDQDEAASKEQHRPTVFNATSIKEIGAYARRCDNIYNQIIILIRKASMRVGEDGGQDTGPQVPAADDLNARMAKLEAFSKSVTKLGGKMRWPWFEPRIKRCHEHLRLLKENLIIRLLVVSIAGVGARPSVVRVFGADDESELRERAEMLLRKEKAKVRAKQSAPKQSNRQLPGSDNGASKEDDATSSTSNASTTSVVSSPSSEVHPHSPASSSSSSSISDPVRRSRRPRKLRASRALRAFRALKGQIRKRTERKSIFKKDSTSVMFGAYLIYPIQGPFPGNPSPPPMKLPFGHRRLTREVKRALRKFNPWDILLILSPQHRVLVDRVTRNVQLAAPDTTNVCLVAIDVDGHVDVDGRSDADISDLEAGDLVWNRMILFFRYEAARPQKGTSEAERDAIGGLPHFTATVRNTFLGSWRKSKKRLDSQEMADQQRREDDRIAEEEAEEEYRERELRDRVEVEVSRREAASRDRQERERRSRERRMDHDRRVADEARLTLLVTQRQEEADERRQREEREKLEMAMKNAIRLEMTAWQNQERQGQAPKDPDVAPEDVETGIGQGEKKIHQNERTKMKAKEEKAAAEDSESPVTFKDAVGRKFSFPFHLVQTWQGMEDLIRQAFLHVGVIGPHVQQGHYDLENSEGHIILPSLWDATIKPGDSVVMYMWPVEEASRPPQTDSPFPGRPMQGVSPPPGTAPEIGQLFSPSPRRADILHPATSPGSMLPLHEAIEQARINVQARQRMLERQQQDRIREEADRLWHGRIDRKAKQEDEVRSRDDEFHQREAEAYRRDDEGVQRDYVRRRYGESVERDYTRRRENDARWDELYSEDNARHLNDDLHQRETDARAREDETRQWDYDARRQQNYHRTVRERYPPPPAGGSASRPAMVNKVKRGRPRKDKTHRAKKTLGSFNGLKPSKKGAKGKHKHDKHKIVGSRDDEDSGDIDKGEDVGDIDKELGLDDLDGAEQMAGKDIDELLKAWTNVGAGI